MKGGRALSRAILNARAYTVENERPITRKDLAGIAREAAQGLNVRPALRHILIELVACWGETTIDGRLMVWPSNAWLMDRTGLSERTVRYGLRALGEMELIAARDSANGKRFARRNAHGEIVEAFGFDLAPLYRRRAEFLELIAARDAARRMEKAMREEITGCRRVVETLLSETDDAQLHAWFLNLQERTRGSPPSDALVTDWDALREAVEIHVRSAGCGGNACPHKEADNDPTSDSWNNAENECVITPERVRAACPILEGFGEKLGSWSDLIGFARQMRGAIGAHESAWREAVENIGVSRAATAVFLVLQMHDDDVSSGAHRMRNPGGYFRAYARMIANEKIDLAMEIERRIKKGGRASHDGRPPAHTRKVRL